MFSGYEVVDAVSAAPLSRAFYPTLDSALIVARLRGGRIWQQDIDRGGRPRGAPVLLQPT